MLQLIAINCSGWTGKEGGAVCALYIKKRWNSCTELSLKNSSVQVKTLFVKAGDQAKKGDVVVHV